MKVDFDKWEEIVLTLTRNKSRSVLTAFGIFWGIFMLIGMLGAGNGMQDMLSKNFKGFATNSAFLYANTTGKPYKGFRRGRWWSLQNADVQRLRQSIPQLDVVTPVLMSGGSNLVYKDKKTDCSVRGVYPDMAKVEENNIRFGRPLNEMDIKEERKVCVIGKKLYKDLFPPGENPCGQYVRLSGVYYRVVGVNYGLSNMGLGGMPEEMVQLPFTVMQKTFRYGDRIDILAVTAKPGVRMAELETRMQNVIKYAHYIAPTDKQALGFISADVLFTMMDNLFKGIRVLIWMVGLGTLLAGAVGVSNIMMVTVKERTSEIGIRRAIGARPRDILMQILSESLVLTCLAGLMGVSFAVLVLQGLELGTTEDGIPQANFQIEFSLALGAILMLLVLGLLAGLAPAFRALAVKPIDAIRDE